MISTAFVPGQCVRSAWHAGCGRRRPPVQPVVSFKLHTSCSQTPRDLTCSCRCEQKKIASPGHGILAMDESNATCGKRLDSIGLENTESNRRTYRELLVSAPGLGDFISGAILFEETLYQSAENGTTFVDLLNKQGIVPGAHVVADLEQEPSLLKGVGEFISGAILFEETLYQSAENGTTFVDQLNKQGIVPGAHIIANLSQETSLILRDHQRRSPLRGDAVPERGERDHLRGPAQQAGHHAR